MTPQNPAPDPEELRAIIAELESLGEEPPEDLLAELRQAEALSEVLDATRGGHKAVETLPLQHAAVLGSQPQTLAGLHLLRGASQEAQLSHQRADVLWREVQHQLPAPSHSPKVVPLRSRWMWTSVAAMAAAILLVFLVGILQKDAKFSPTTQPNKGAVAQIELEQAEQNLRTIERESLRQLLSARNTPAGAQQGDHFLRNLRQARHEAVRARFQARVRRL